MQTEWRTVDHAFLDSDQRFTFLTEHEGRVRVVAFVDFNGDGVHQRDEPSASSPTFVAESSDQFGVIDGVVLALPAVSTADGPTVTLAADLFRRIRIGEVSTLDDARFDRNVSVLGVEDPLEFMRAHGAGLFLLHEWIPGVTPIVFIHGLGGTPREFTEIVASLDPHRFQPVMAHYPSGWRLSDTSEYLSRILSEFHARFASDEVHVVAHSMGGLIARRALGILGRDPTNSWLTSLTTIASPLSGHPMALAGVRFALTVVPSWRDLATNSDLLRDLYVDPLPRSCNGTSYRDRWTTSACAECYTQDLVARQNIGRMVRHTH